MAAVVAAAMAPPPPPPQATVSTDPGERLKQFAGACQVLDDALTKGWISQDQRTEQLDKLRQKYLV